MPCKNCQEKPVIKLTNVNVSLCKQHFLRYFEKKVKKTIRTFNLIEKGNKIGIALSGGKDSFTVLSILKQFQDKKIITLEALAIDEGIKAYRDLTNAKKFCKDNNITLHILNYEDFFNHSLDKMVKKFKNKTPCSFCGVFRRYLLNYGSKKFKFDKLATGHNLDDESQSILMNQFRNNPEVSARLGPITGVMIDKRFIRRIKPLYFVTEKETTTYSFLKGFPVKFSECPYASFGYRNSVRDMLNEFELKYPGTKHSIVDSFIKILPSLKQQFKEAKALSSCKLCNEPTSKKICQACEYVRELKDYKNI